jgi:chorismate synthase
MGAAVAGQGHGLRLVCVVDDTPLNHDVTRFS